MRVAPASRAFSSSSFTTDAGRSTTSPAAILLATFSESTWMRPMADQTKRSSQFRRSRAGKQRAAGEPKVMQSSFNPARFSKGGKPKRYERADKYTRKEYETADN